MPLLLPSSASLGSSGRLYNGLHHRLFYLYSTTINLFDIAIPALTLPYLKPSLKDFI